MPKSKIEVGRSADGLVFVGVPNERYDTVLKPMSRTRMHLALISFDDLDWLIEALTKEKQRGERLSQHRGEGCKKNTA